MSGAAGGIIARDPVTFEVVRSALAAICAEMKEVVMRTSFSPLLSLSADLSCALLDAGGRVVGQGDDIPVHLGAVPFTVRAALAAFPAEEWRPGDAVLLNDPYAGGTHLPDMSLIAPVFAESARIGFSISRVHWPDVGGIAPGSSGVCDDIIKEGLRVPPIRIREQGTVREDMLRLLLANMRVPRDREGDFRAQLAGAARAERRLQEVAARYGVATLTEVMAATQAHSALLVRRRLSRLPDAVVEHAEQLDGDGVDPDARPLVRVRITKRGDGFAVDFTGSAPCVRGPVNAPLAVTASAVYYVLLGLTGGGVAPNEGVYSVAEIVAPPGSVVNAAPPAPVVAANTETSNRLADIMLAALAKAYPDRVPAGSYGSACVYTIGGATGHDGGPFVHYETIGGGMGGSIALPGAPGIRVHMGNTMNLPVEAIEAAVPVRFLTYGLVRGSGGAGLRRGGDGVHKAFEVLAERVEASILTERTETPALGVCGGAPGATARITLRRAGGEEVALPAKSGPHTLRRGDRIEMVTAGGGGWGAPQGREEPG